MTVRGDPNYARYIYNDMADTFENKLVNVLEYRGPWILKEMIDEILTSSSLESLYPFHQRECLWRILDIGCGSGLCGKVFHDYVVGIHSELVSNEDKESSVPTVTEECHDVLEAVNCDGSLMIGIDVSDRMVQIAKATGMYTHVVCCDLTSSLSALAVSFNEDELQSMNASHLKNNTKKLHLLLAADTFIYVGALGRIFELAAEVLYQGGFFGFTTEALETSPMLLEQNENSYPNIDISFIKKASGINDFKDIPIVMVDSEIKGAVPGWGARLLTSARFAHSAYYIEVLCNVYSFKVLSYRSISLRKEEGKSLPGHAFILVRL